MHRLLSLLYSNCNCIQGITKIYSQTLTNCSAKFKAVQEAIFAQLYKKEFLNITATTAPKDVRYCQKVVRIMNLWLPLTLLSNFVLQIFLWRNIIWNGRRE